MAGDTYSLSFDASQSMSADAVGGLESPVSILKSRRTTEIVLPNEDTADVQLVMSMQSQRLLYLCLCILTGGLLYVLGLWFRRIEICITTTSNLQRPGRLMALVTHSYGDPSLIPIQREEETTFFEYQCVRYIYNGGNWVPSCRFGDGWDLYCGRSSISDPQAHFGKNLNDVKERSYARLLRDEVLHPFYVFQFLSIGLWLAELYYLYSISILIISGFSILTSVITTKKNRRKLRDMAHYTCPILVHREGNWIRIDSSLLVPGDIVIHPPETEILPCDSILLQGSCIVDESMLTGESVAVSKEGVFDSNVSLDTVLKPPQTDMDTPTNAKTLFSGSRLLHQSTEMLCVVLATGFNTKKGVLLRTVLHPKPHVFEFVSDSIKIVAMLVILAILGFVYTISIDLYLKGNVTAVVLNAFDLITVIVPPALPASLTLGLNAAAKRLQKRGIYCISLPRIHVAGTVDLCCFDKTGTLTESAMHSFGFQVIERQTLSNTIPKEKLQPKKQHKSLGRILASCHSIRMLKGKLVGDPLEVDMFESSRYKLGEQGPFCTVSGEEIRILKRFEFSSHLKRMSVLVHIQDELFVFTKGAPEVVLNHCNVSPQARRQIESTIYKSASNGYRIIACAMKAVSDSNGSRSDYESGLIVVGTVLFENKIKAGTLATLDELHDANIRNIIATGDNVLTAAFVAAECRILPREHKTYYPVLDESSKWVFKSSHRVDEHKTVDFDSLLASTNTSLAVNGAFLRHCRETRDTDTYSKLLQMCHVYARLSPDDKMLLVNDLRTFGSSVLMCGDGANDCGALKTADVGISLAETEASIAAPFTSMVSDISCVSALIKEGRCSLITSFSSFKFIIMYSLLQFTPIVILRTFLSNFSDVQFLFQDLFVVLPLSILSVETKASSGLRREKPTTRLFSFEVTGILFVQLILQACLQISVHFILTTQKWYSDGPVPGFRSQNTVQTSVLWVLSTAMILVVAVLYNLSHEHRQPMTKNIPFLSFLVLITIVFLLFVFIGQEFQFLQFVPFDGMFKVYLLLFSILFALLSYFIEFGCIFSVMLEGSFTRLE